MPAGRFRPESPDERLHPIRLNADERRNAIGPADLTQLTKSLADGRERASIPHRGDDGVRHIEAELLEFVGEACRDARAVAALEVIGAEVLIGDATTEHPVDRGQD